MSQTDSPLGTAPVGKLVLQLAIPAMLAQFVNILYSVVDRMYVGHIAGAGDAALAGVGVCAPVVTMITAIGALIGFGGGPLMSIRMGGATWTAHVRSSRTASTFAGAERAGDRAAAYFQAADPVHLRLQRAPVGLRAGVLLRPMFSGTVFALLSYGLNQITMSQGFRVPQCGLLCSERP